MIRFAIGGFIVLFGTGSVLWGAAPRLYNEFRYADQFVPAQDLKITNYKCTNWDVGVFDRCVVTFESKATHAVRRITDWRFGRAPAERVVLLQRRDDATAVTTDVSLRTLWNRAAMTAAFALFGILVLFACARKIMTTANANLRPVRVR